MAHSTRRVLALTVAAFGSLSLVACGGGFEEPTTGQSSSATGATSGSAGGVPSGQTLRMLIASSGDAETNAVKEAAAAWGAATGNTVEVTVASDMAQELAQSFAGGSPADVMYMDAGAFATYAKQGSL